MSAPAERTLLGIALMVGSVLLLSLMDTMIKHVVATVPVLQVAAIRAAMVTVLALAWSPWRGGIRALRTARPWLQLARAATAFIAVIAFFESLRLMPLATAIAIGSSSPLFMVAFSVLLLKERVDAHRLGAVVIGFMGVVVITEPGGAGVSLWGVAVIMTAAVFFALTQVVVRMLARGDTDISILFYTNLGIFLMSAVALPFFWAPIGWASLVWIAAMAALLLAGQWLAIQAYRHASVGATAPYQYLELGFAAYLGWAIWGETVAPNVWVGAAIIVAGGLYILFRETRGPVAPVAPPR